MFRSVPTPADAEIKDPPPVQGYQRFPRKPVAGQNIAFDAVPAYRYDVIVVCQHSGGGGGNWKQKVIPSFSSSRAKEKHPMRRQGVDHFTSFLSGSINY